MDDASARTSPAPDMAFYERLIDEGIADADRRGGAIDHLTARRLAIWLTARSQQPDLAAALAKFTRTGAITKALRAQLRDRAYSPSYPNRSQVWRLVQYCASRSTDPGPIGPDFASACDQIDRADAMLASLRDRVQRGKQHAPARPDAEGPPVIARAERDSQSRTVSFILDEATANIAMYAITAHAQEREAHVREVERFGDGLPEGSYGKENRQAIAARETRVAARLRAIERAYQIAPDRAPTPTPTPTPTPDPASTYPAPQASDREMELE